MNDTIYQKLQRVRVQVGKLCTKKSGRNDYAGFDYFELKDFLPISNECFEKEGLCPVFCIDKNMIVENDGVVKEKSVATLTIYDGTSSVEFRTPVAEAQVGKNSNPIQNLGAQHTYLKRYLYMNALELSENDIVDATAGKNQDTKVSMATIEQVDLIMSQYDSANIQKIKEYYHVDNIEKLTAVQASQVLANKKKEKKNE